MDPRQEEELKSKKRNEILIKILEEEHGIDVNQVPNFIRKLIEAMPIASYDKRALNSLKHGMNSKTILPCKLKSCIHSQYCAIYQQADISHIEIGSPCRLEVELYLQTVEGLARKYAEKESIASLDILAEYIMVLIMNDRNRRLIAREGGFIARAEVSRQNNKGLSLGFRYWSSARNSTNKVIDKLLTE